MASSKICQYSNIVNGQLRTSEVVHRGTDPSTLHPLWEVPVATLSDLEDAVSAAQSAFLSWSRTSWDHRQEKLAQMGKILELNRAEMTEILIKECGKPEAFAALEVTDSVNMLNFHATTSPLAETIVQDDAHLKLILSYKPIGVVGAIGPWNFPLVLCMGKIAASLLTGNTVIVKPSPFTPYSILKFIEWVRPVLPAGVLQGLNGDNQLGPAMVTHPMIPKISFTGSTATGKKIMEAGSRSLKRMTLELGGNDACIVCADVDIKEVAPQVALGAFFNSGQICVASKRIFVHEDIYADFVQAMVDAVKSWAVGPVSQPGMMLGPIQNAMQYDIVKGYIEDCKAKGYRFALGGEVPATGSFTIQPAIIDNPPDDSLIVTSEPFGPIVPIQPWKTEDEVISRANNTTSGLGGSVWSPDVDKAYRIANRIDSGSVWINSFGKPLAQGYFSGQKESGVGGELGRHGLLSYCNAKMIHHYKTPASKI